MKAARSMKKIYIFGGILADECKQQIEQARMLSQGTHV
jgi:hypothetical protein